MNSIFLRSVVAFAVLALVAVNSLRGQEEKVEDVILNKKKTLALIEKAQEEYRVFFKKPDKAIEFWAAIKFEMELGKFDLAALHMKLLLAKEPPDEVDKDLVKIEAAEGMSAFLRLKRVREWSDYAPFQKEAVANVDTLIDRVTKGVEKYLSDPTRIKKFMKQLVAPTEEERGFAFVQLARSRERAVPYLIEGLRTEKYGSPLFLRYREMLMRMDPETVPVYLEALRAVSDKDARDLELRLTLLDVIHRRQDKRAIPYLWHLSTAKQYPQAVKTKAKEVLAALLKLPVGDVPIAKEALTALAERYYQHKVPFLEGKPILIWPWDGEGISLKPVELTRAQMEEYLGLRYARQALDLDPAYGPAQVVLLLLTLERHYQQRVDQLLMEPLAPKMHQLLTTIDADLLIRVMERALDEHQIPVVLPLIQALGERAETKAIRVNLGGRPSSIARALYYPDRRVQFAALRAMLRMPPTSPPPASERIVELCRRFLAGGPNPRALAGFVPPGDEGTFRDVLKGLGFEAVLPKGFKEFVAMGRGAADFDLVVLHPNIKEQEFPYLYTQLRKDPDIGGLPIIVLADKSREKSLQKYLAKDPNAIVLRADKFQVNDEMKDLVEWFTKKVQFAKLTPAERKEFSRVSMDTLWRMARGEIKGYHLMPALDVIVEQLRVPEYALEALEILGRLPGKQVQYKLASIVADPARDKKMRIPATMELNRHLQKNGVQLDKKLISDLKLAYKDAADEPVLRKELTITVSMLAQANATQTGGQLIKFRPDPPPAPKK